MTKILLDARELEQPKPFEKAVLILNKLDDSSYLYMLHRREPLALLELVKNKGFVSLSKKDDKNTWHIIIAKNKNLDISGLLDV